MVRVSLNGVACATLVPTIELRDVSSRALTLSRGSSFEKVASLLRVSFDLLLDALEARGHRLAELSLEKG
jgi:hypothetical protein